MKNSYNSHRLLILTQKIDKNDPILGFFHKWVLEFAKKFEEVTVICLEKGESNLPENVEILSLGKEDGRSKIKYVWNFYKYIFKSRNRYDSVFVHMNQEYVLLGGVIWKIMGKKVYLWRNHPHGNLLTRIAVGLSNKVFCTSKFSYTAKFKKTKIMPVGIDTSIFNTEYRIKNQESSKNKILFLGRMSPIKRPELLIEALGILQDKNIDFEADFYGDPLPKDEDYYDSLKSRVKELGLDGKVNFYKGVPNHETPEIYNEHGIFVNLTPTGSFDKTILEAATCGCISVITNESMRGEIDERMMAEEETPEGVAERLYFWLNTSGDDKLIASKEFQKYVLKNQSLEVLSQKLEDEIKP